MEQKRIIVADDEAIIRMGLSEMLTSSGYVVVGKAGDGKSAINMARDLKPDLAIMDIRMPTMDGITAAHIMHKERIAPVVLLTAFSWQDLVEKAKDAGVAGYLVKPFQEAELTPVIEVALARYRDFRTLDDEVEDLQEALETRKLVDRAKGILMDTKNMTEAEALERISRTCARTPKRKTARMSR
ncbi:MAG: response regulator [Chloroflexota bacterium]